MRDLDTPPRKGLGGKTAKALANHLELETVGDLLYHFPRRYDERGEHTDIRSLAVGEQVTVMAQVQRSQVRPMRARRGDLLEVTVGDGTGGVLGLTFFNQAWRERDLKPGRWGLFAGKVTEFRGKRRAADWPAVPRLRRSGGLLDAFEAALPYQLTEGQRAVGVEIAEDLSRPHPMHRLLQGEVGSGKTVCALRAMLQVVDAGGQAALLAPTEVLAAQHRRGIADLLGPLGRAGELDGADRATRVTLLTGSLGAGARRTALAEVASGEAGLVIGTHALLYEGVDFADLGLVVVDEQHRFGVEQRDALRAKANQPPHVLVMTATPIPRTVAMTVYGALEISR